MLEFKSKKDHAYEDWQSNIAIEIKVNGEILEWVPRDLQYLEMEMGWRK